ncbi:MAG: hypothetical protein BWY06_00498 [Candidatus Latescibacteria bacterium ADurb.Bin168]|nr:MAG: hypothetical protein BWY06_00498 [Candidatus Latescibacteria bacterium ADurb.Bin168]
MKASSGDSIRPPFQAYRGDALYAFVSYAHKDSALVYRDISALHVEGYRLWYDEGIEPGSEWPEDVAQALERCALFLLFISPSAVASRNVRNEIHLALSRNKPIVAIYLEETKLPSGLELQIGAIQAVMRFRDPEVEYRRKLERALAPHQRLRGESGVLVGPPVSKKKLPLAAVVGTAAVVLAIFAGIGWWLNASTESALVSARDSTGVSTNGRVDSTDSATGSSSTGMPTAAEEIRQTLRSLATPAVARDAPATPSPSGAARSPGSTPPVRGIPRGAIVCVTGPAGGSVAGAMERALGEASVPIATSRTGSCEAAAEGLLGRGSLPASIAGGPEARAYIAIETEVNVQDSTYWMVECNAKAVLALVGDGGTRIRQFDFVPARTGVQPDRQSAIRSATQQLISDNATVFRQIAEAAGMAR